MIQAINITQVANDRLQVYNDCCVKATITIGGMNAIAKNELDTLEDLVEGTQWEKPFRPYIKQANKAYQAYYDCLRKDMSERGNFFLWCDYMANIITDSEINMTYMKVALSNRLNKLHIDDVEIKAQSFIALLMCSEATQYFDQFFNTYEKNGYDYRKFFSHMRMTRMKAAMEKVVGMCCREEVNLDADKPFVDAYNALFNKLGSKSFLNRNGKAALTLHADQYADALKEMEQEEEMEQEQQRYATSHKTPQKSNNGKDVDNLSTEDIRNRLRQKYKVK